MLKGPYQNLLINRICPNPLMFLQGVQMNENAKKDGERYLKLTFN